MRKLRVLFASLLLLISCLGLQHVDASESIPSARFGHRMVYDPVNERVLLFGGAVWENRYTFFDDLWSYDYSTNTWTEIDDGSGPQGRFNFMMIYLPDHHQIFLFGGYSANDRISDTWVYDITDNRWTKLRTENSPSPRSDAAIAHDLANDVVILYDGYCRDDSHPQDTWAFDFDSIDWTRMDPENPPRPQYGHHMVYDTENRMLVMYGGHWSIQGTRTHGYSDGVWTYDYPTDAWTKIDEATTPPGRYWHSVAYDGGTGKLVVFGGSTADFDTSDDTWLFDAASRSWESVETDEPPPGRANSAMAYDQANGKVIMFGGLREVGEPPLDDLWVLDTAEGTWVEVPSDPASTEGQGGPSEPTSAEEEDEEPDQPGIPGFPLPSIILSMVLIMILWADGRRSNNGAIGAKAG